MIKENFLERAETREQKIIRLLKSKGVENEEVGKELMEWTKFHEKEAMKSADSEMMIRFNLLRAKTYFQAGYVEEAIENIEAVLIQTQNENREELHEEALEELETMRQEQVLREH